MSLGFGALGACTSTELGDCPPGTVLEGKTCIADVEVLACGEGTHVQNGQCVADCDPVCDGRQCGPDGCNGVCGECADGELCTADGVCEAVLECVPVCVVSQDGPAKECGDDGCGGSCGNCEDPELSVCDPTTFTCIAECIPDCRHRACGDDGCGGSCGTCAEGSCSPAGACLPPGWACAVEMYGSRDECDCGCGAADLDCQDPRLAVVGCDPDSRCDAGTCVPRVPVEWACDHYLYGDGVACDCGCGAVDPDCGDDTLYVFGCVVGETCGPEGACVACTGACDGKACGSDGCGGSCGICDEGLACVEHQCIEGCQPTPIICATHHCGDDGCGGSCGDCPTNTTCTNGECEVDPGYSCEGYCLATTPAGCGCDAACIGFGDCCPDFENTCVCHPDCTARVCGDDGCGGSCGSCDGDTPFCGLDGNCQGACAPSCAPGRCGDDGCGGSCGECGDGETCNAYGRCTPAGWTCADFFYGDGRTCDCGCGAIDPDCETIGLTNGCPLGAACSDQSGLCDLAFCSADSQCTPPAWCVGNFLAGADGRRRGVCEPPEPNGKPDGGSCVTDYDCASDVCAGGQCRAPCGADADCELGEACIGFELVDGLTARSLGVVTVCDSRAQVGAACGSQSACAGDPECLAFIDPATLGVMYRCGHLPNGEADEEAACETNADCEPGLVCADGACGRACPGGNGDCPPLTHCGEAALQGRATAVSSDDVMAKICVPN